MPLTEAQSSFLQKHLGVVISEISEASDGANTRPDTRKTKLLPIWRDAKEGTDAAVSALQKALRDYGHSDLDKIADAGMNGITDGNSVALLKMLIEYDSADANNVPAAAGKLLKQVDAYRGFLDSSDLISLAENNPFGVALKIKPPLRAALSEIAAAASAQTAQR